VAKVVLVNDKNQATEIIDHPTVFTNKPSPLTKR
jgi:hypothetical protein